MGKFMDFIGNLGNVGSSLGSVGSLFNAAFQSAAQRRQDYYQRRQMSIQHGYQRELMAYQYDLNKMAFDAANEYNLPINQVKRLLEAGINPASLSGMGQGDSMSASSLGSSGMGSPGLPNFSMSGGPMNPIAAQTRLLDSQSELARAQARYYNRQSTDVADAAVALNQAAVSAQESQAKLNSVQAQQVALNNKFVDQKNQAWLDLTESQVDQTVAGTNKLVVETCREIFALRHVDPQRAQNLAAEQTLILSQAWAARASAQRDMSQVAVNNQLAELYKNQALDMFQKYLVGSDQNYGYKAMNKMQIEYHQRLMAKDKELAELFDAEGRLKEKENDTYYLRLYMSMLRNGAAIVNDLSGFMISPQKFGRVSRGVSKRIEGWNGKGLRDMVGDEEFGMPGTTGSRW